MSEGFQHRQDQSVDREEHEHLAQGRAAKRVAEVLLTTVIDYDGSNNPIYVGRALQGSAKDAPLWQIRKITYDGSNNPTDIQFANSTDNFDKVWDDRVLGYSYG